MPKAERHRDEKPPAYRRFEQAVHEILTVSKDELNRRASLYRKQRAQEKRRKGRD